MSSPDSKFYNQVLTVVAILGVAIIAGIVIYGPQSENPGIIPNGVKQGVLYSESPLLSDRVNQGSIPPVENRLPITPLIVQPVDNIGKYGGTWHMGLKGYGDTALIRRTIMYELLVRWDPDWTRVVPNIAQAYEVNDDSTKFTFHLREDMKWSDGESFTADDILFYFEDLSSNDEYNPSGWIQNWLKSGGEPAEVTKLDNYTIVFEFKEPYSLFLHFLAHPDSHFIIVPKHYVKQFHPKYNQDIQVLVDEEGVDDWPTLFKRKINRFTNLDLPTLNAWKLVDVLEEGVEQVRAVRNPYYWKVDSDLNQLPYIDEVVFVVKENEEELLQLVYDGVIDMQALHIGTTENKELLEENANEGEYSLFRTTASYATRNAISLNLNHMDPVLREIFGNKNFRIGLSHAIDRQGIIDEIYAGEGTPFQVAPRPESPFYHERLSTQYTEYNVTLANEYLDKAGYSERDIDGFRLGPDGNRINFTLVFGDWNNQNEIDTMNRVIEQWSEIGIMVDIEFMGWRALRSYSGKNQHDAIGLTAGGMDVLMYPHRLIPTDPSRTHFAVAWAEWYKYEGTSERSEEPPEQVKEQFMLYDQLKSTTDFAEQAGLMRNILDITADQFYSIGVNLTPDGYGIVKKDFHNVPDVMPDSWTYPTPAPTNPCQYYIE